MNSKPKLAAGPKLRAVLYLRQSTFREESISLELQEHQGRAYAERQGYEVVAVESDPGISGRTWNRPAVQRVIAMVEDGAAEVIVLWKWSRLSRSRYDWAMARHRVLQAGGKLESATELNETDTPEGRLMLDQMVSWAVYESERIGGTWKEAHSRRARNGLPANGKPRFGYAYTKDEGFSPDPVTAPILQMAFHRYISGESVYSLVAWMNSGTSRPVSGYGVKGDGLWSDRTLRRVMDSGFAAGFISVNGELLPGAHTALISESDWDAYLEARQRRRTYRRTERSEYLLSGMVWCACGSKMHAGITGSNRTAKFRCKDAHEKRTHTGGYVMESVLEADVWEWLLEREQVVRARIAAELQVAPRLKAVADPARKLRAALESNASKMDALTERLVDSGIPHDSYVRMRDKLIAQRKAVEIELRSVAVQETKAPIVILPSLIENWDGLTIAERRELLRALIARVEVTPGRPRATVRIIGRD